MGWIVEQFSLISRWAFPESTGGVAMHNHYLLIAIKEKFKCHSVSIDSEIKSIFSENNAIHHYRIPVPAYNISHYLKFSILKNAFRSYTDQKISRLYSKYLYDQPGLVEFMDIHSEGYHFLKTYPQKRKQTLIRSHTPFSLLRKFYNNNELRGVDTWYAFKREKKCFKWAQNITTPSEDLKTQLIEIFKIRQEKIKVIPNILDTNHFTPKNNVKNNNFSILHVGRFEKAKGVETLIKAFIHLAKIYNDIHLTCIGYQRGSSFEKCKNYLNKENLIDNVSFEGFIPYERLPEFYGKSDIVVVPSEIYESFSYTVAQGMACGKPVVASDIGGIPETVNKGQGGVLFDTGNVQDLIEKIESLYLNENDRKYIGVKARDYAVNNFSIEALGPKYIEYYQSLAP